MTMKNPLLEFAQLAPQMSEAELRAVLALVVISHGRDEFVATYEDVKQASGGRLSSTDGVAKGLKGAVLEMFFERGKRRSQWRTLRLTEGILRLTEQTLCLTEGMGYPQSVDNYQTLRLTEGTLRVAEDSLRIAEDSLCLTEGNSYPQTGDNSQTLRVTEETLRVTEGMNVTNPLFSKPNALLGRVNTPSNRVNTPPNSANTPPNRANGGATSHGRAGAFSSSSSSIHIDKEDKKKKKEEDVRTGAPARSADARLQAWLAEHAPTDDQRKAWRLLRVHANVAPMSVGMADILANTPLEGNDGIRAHVEAHKAYPEKYPANHLITAIRNGPAPVPSLEEKAEPAATKGMAKIEAELAEWGHLLVSG